MRKIGLCQFIILAYIYPTNIIIPLISGHSSVVERLVANEKVEGSSPFARSKKRNMEDLSKKKCIPCDGNIPAMEINEIHKYLKKVDGWDVKK